MEHMSQALNTIFEQRANDYQNQVMRSRRSTPAATAIPIPATIEVVRKSPIVKHNQVADAGVNVTVVQSPMTRSGIDDPPSAAIASVLPVSLQHSLVRRVLDRSQDAGPVVHVHHHHHARQRRGGSVYHPWRGIPMFALGSLSAILVALVIQRQAKTLQATFQRWKSILISTPTKTTNTNILSSDNEEKVSTSSPPATVAPESNITEHPVIRMTL